MGFYGNITNTARTQFSFDRSYASRYEMDENCDKDGVYAGRYVLIEYDNDLTLDVYNSKLFCVNYDDSKEYIMYGQMDTTHGVGIYTGPLTSTKITAKNSTNENGVTDGQVVRIVAGNKIYNINSETRYIRITNYPNYTTTDQTEYNTYWENPDHEDLLDMQNVAFHIIDGTLTPDDSSLDTSKVLNGMCFALPTGYIYATSDVDEYWMASIDEDNNVSWNNTTSEDWVRVTSSGTRVNVSGATSNYLQNFSIDVKTYGTSRGYDSTVWQKMYSNNEEKYVMVAELNTVVPTFDMCADAPTLVPITPHFDANSTNVYYRFHWQPQWGFRPKAASNILRVHKIDSNGEILEGATVKASTQGKRYPSDQKTTWEGTFYNSLTDKTTLKYYSPTAEDWVDTKLIAVTSLDENTYANNVDQKYYVQKADGSFELGGSTYNNATQYFKADESIDLDAAIYFNKNGFSPTVISYSQDLYDTEQKAYNEEIANSGWVNANEILFSPTGISGHVYNPHDGSVDLKAAADTQELSIMLPSLGDTIAQIWDLVYGGRSTTNEIKLTNERNTNIQWESADNAILRKGLRLVTTDGTTDTGFGYSVNNATTLAGCINSVHDLMGMIIVPNAETLKNNVADLDPNYIYYDSEARKYMRKHIKFNYDELKYKYVLTNIKEDSYYPGFYYEDSTGTTTANNPFASYDADDDGVIQLYVKMASDDNENLWIAVSLYGFTSDCYYNTQPDLNGDGQPDGDYIYNTESQPDQSKVYYEFYNATPVQLSNSYAPNSFYYPYTSEDNGITTKGYVLSTSAEAQTDVPYYEINSKYSETINTPLVDKATFDTTTGLYGTGENATELTYLYVPDLFYYNDTISAYSIESQKDTDVKIIIRENTPVDELEWDDDGYLIPPIDEKTGEARQYYMMDIQNMGKETPVSRWDPDLNGYVSDTVIAENYQCTAKYPIRLRKFIDPLTNVVKEKYYFIAETTIAYDDDGNSYNKPSNYQLVTTDLLKTHYEKHFNSLTGEDVPIQCGYYYYKFDQDNGIIKQGVFYMKNRYWYQPVGTKNYVLDRNDEITFTDWNTYEISPSTDSLTVGKRTYVRSDENTLIYTESDGTILSYNIDTDNNTIDLPIDRTYYSDITMVRNTHTLYRPDRYYELADDGTYVLDRKDTFDNKQHYTKNDIYVTDDEWNLYTKGSKWNTGVDEIPASVSLSTREEEFEFQELKGFARSLNTIHGLILKINDLIEFNDTETRDINTVQGCLNTLRDTIAKFEKLEPRQFCVVDSYGRVQSTPWTTSQVFSTKNEQTSITETNSIATTENRWIYTDINPDANNPLITIKHQFTAVPDTTTISDKNIALTSGTLGNNNNTNDTLTLYTPIVDAMGHVVGKNTETVTLPFGFKNLKAQNYSGDENKWSQSGGATESTGEHVRDIIADSTKDSVTFAGGNKWIRFQTSPTTDAAAADSNSISTGLDKTNILTIAHETHDIDTATATASDINGNGDTITIQDISFDTAGHATANKLHTYTLPYGFKTIKVTNDSTTVADAASTISADGQIADNTQDTLIFAASNKWIKLDNSTEDTVKIGHEVHTIDTAANSTTNLNKDTGAADEENIDIPDWTYDAAGHILSKKPHTYTLPYGFKTITTNGMGSNTAVNATTTLTNTSTIAEQTQDSLAIDSGDKWIRIVASTTNKANTITISHDIHSVSPTTSTQNLSSGTSETITFDVPTYGFDNAGHYNSKDVKTITMPFSYGKIVADKVGEESSTTSASATFDTLSILGDSWISSVATTDTVTLTHKDPVQTDHTVIANVTPAFGSTFSITDLDFDSKGHKANSGSHTVKIPGLELTTAESSEGNVLISLGYAYDEKNAKGVFTQKSEHLGKIALGDYTKPTSLTTAANATISASDFSSTTLLNAAIAALDKRIMDEEKARADAVDGLDVDGASSIAASKTISAWSETNGKVSISTQDISITSSQVSDLDTTISTAINALDVSTVASALTSTATTFVSAVTEADGKISVTTNTLPTASTSVAGIVQLSDATNSTSTSLAATANAVKAAYDLAGKAIVANTEITAGTATKITYDKKGLVTKGENLTASDIPNLTASKITDLGTMAKESKDNYINTSTEYTYTAAVVGSGTADAPETPEKKYTFAGLMNHISKLEAAIVALGGTIPED